jgi:uncharacterized protein (TIGR03067 family)
MTARCLGCFLALLPLLLLSVQGAEPKEGGPKDSPAIAAERAKLVGMWGMYRPGKDEMISVLQFHEDGMCSVLNSNYQLSWRNKYSFDPTTKPKQLDHPDSGGGLQPGIYELDGDTMKLCLRASFGERPTEFKEEKGAHLFTLKRVREKPEKK